MTTIDDKVVSASFESSKFEAGVSKTLSALDKLKAGLKLDNAGKGLENINTAASKVNLGHIGQGIEQVTTKLGALNVAAVAIFANIAMKAVAAGAQFAKSFTIQPIIQGYQEYSTNLNAIQTILANTQASGATLDDVNAALQDLNTYSDKTIYNFSQMAKNIGTFTAAGVDLKTATGAIKGIANLAALSGSNSEQASTAMYQLSQAISAGRVGLQDWNSVVNAGMGGTVFQRALAQTAVAMGDLKDGSLKLVGPMKNVSINGESFRQSMQAGPGKQPWLTSKVLTTTLKQFTGDLSDAEVKAMGFNEEQIKSIQQTAKTAMHAATEVKTLTQVFDVAKETAGSGWAKTFQIIFGDFGEAKKTFTDLSNTINGFINTNADARNKVLADWKKLGGRAMLIDNIKTAFHNLGLILRPIKKAFRDIFPAATGRDLLNLTARFAAFAQALKPTPTTMQNLRRTFRGFFAILDIGKQIVGGIFTVLGELFHVAGGGQGSFLKLTATIGDFLVSLDKSLKKGDRLHKFFVGLGHILAVPLKILTAVAGAIGDLFSRFSPGGFSGQIDTVTKAMTPFEKVLHSVADAWDNFVSGFGDVRTVLQPAFDAIAQLFQGLGPNISDAIRNMNVEAILQVVRTGLLAGIFLLIKNFLGKGSFAKQLGGIGGGIFQNIGASFGALTGSMKAMQRSLQAKTLKDIAIAIALLAASVVALSFVDPKKLNSALTAITIMFGELLAAMKIMDKIASSRGAIKLPFVAASLILLATAIDILAIAVFTLSRLSWEELSKGLGAVAVLMTTIVAAAGPLSKASPRLVIAGAGISAIAVGLNVMALAVRNFGSMDLKQLAKGLGAVAVSLGIVGFATKAMPVTMPLIGAGLIAVAIGLRIMANAVATFGNMDWEVIHKGLVGIGASLLIVAAAMHLMPANMPLTAVGLLLVSLSLGKIAKALASMGNMSIKQIAHGLIALGGALAILAAGLYAMSGSLAGAAALGVAALGISVLVPALESLGKQSWKQIIKSIVALGLAFALLGAAGLALAPVTPALLGIGAALLLLGAGMALAGAGIFLIGAGLSAIAVAGSSAVAILIQAAVDFTEAVPKMLKNLVIGILQMVKALAKTAPQFVDALVKIIASLLDAIIKSTPKLVQAIETLLTALLKILDDKQEDIIQAGFNLLLALLAGIANNITKVVDIAAKIIVKFLKGLADNIEKIILAGAEIITHLITGLGTAAGKIVTAGVDAVISFIRGLGKNAIKLAKGAGQVILDFIAGLTAAVDEYEPRIIKASLKLGAAIITGMLKGLVPKKVYDKAKEIGKKVLHHIAHPFDWNSPSKTMIELGNAIVEGLAWGMDDHRDATRAAEHMSNNVIDTFNSTLQTASPSKVMYRIGKYVGKGFANGLVGSSADVSAAFHVLNGKISDAIAAVKKTIAKEEAKRAGLLKGKDLTARLAAAQVQPLIDANKALLAVLTSSRAMFGKAMRDQKVELLQWGKQYDELTKKIVAAKQVLVDARKTRDDFAAQVAGQYGELPEINTESADQLVNYEKALADRITAIKAYKTTLDKLRKLGLDDRTYQKLISEGTVDQKFADQLLTGGRSAIKDLNKLDSSLDSASKSLGKTTASNLYQMGVDTAQGIIDGLKSQREGIVKVMEIIADEMVAAIKKKLKIKSPSEVFGEIGGYASAGIAKGLLESSRVVTDAVYSIGDDAAKAMSDSLSQISNAVAKEVDPNPIITPILDLSSIQNGAKTLGSILNPGAIRPVASARQASAISSAQIPASIEGTDAIPVGSSLTFEQNNYSPKALSSVDIYRQTRNQLSVLRSLINPMRGVVDGTS